MSVCHGRAQNRFHLLIFWSFSDLDLFSSEERESVYVKEGQGAVLLCAPPPHYPGLFDLLPFFIIFCLFLVSSAVMWKEKEQKLFPPAKIPLYSFFTLSFKFFTAFLRFVVPPCERKFH